MPEKKDIELLLQNIQEGLKKYTVKELNDAIITFLSKKGDKFEEINYVLQLVIDEFNITMHTLKKSNARGPITEAKQIAYCILHFNIGLSTRYIAKRIFNNWHTSVHTGILKLKRSDINHKQDKQFIDRYELLSNRFIEHFTKEKTK